MFIKQIENGSFFIENLQIGNILYELHQCENKDLGMDSHDQTCLDT